jgi:hypothetical protein
LSAETLLGIKELLDRNGIDTISRPVVVLVKNIKQFPQRSLNDLIHVMHKYRGSPHFLNLNLMLGVQNNSKEEIHQRVNIRNCLKLMVKTFWFPSMKNVMFEVVYKMLFNSNLLISFQP